MPLLEKVRRGVSGLEGFEESGKWVPIGQPLPCVLIFKEGERAIEELKKEARENNDVYYQLAEIQNVQAATEEIRVMPYIAYLRG